jgi:hypothetical protein
VFNQSETELTTAATDALLAAICLIAAFQLWTTPTPAALKRTLWVSVFGLLSCASWLGAVAHGWQWSEVARTTIWRPLYLSLGLAVALMLVGALYDWQGETVARAALPWALGVGVLFFAATQVLSGAFVLFIVYEGVAICAALAIYVAVVVSGGLPGSAAIGLGIALSVVAAAIQASNLSLRVVVRFDHNGLFHLVQIAGVIALASGLRTSLRLGSAG